MYDGMHPDQDPRENGVAVNAQDRGARPRLWVGGGGLTCLSILDPCSGCVGNIALGGGNGDEAALGLDLQGKFITEPFRETQMSVG